MYTLLSVGLFVVAAILVMNVIVVLLEGRHSATGSPAAAIDGDPAVSGPLSEEGSQPPPFASRRARMLHVYRLLPALVVVVVAFLVTVNLDSQQQGNELTQMIAGLDRADSQVAIDALARAGEAEALVDAYHATDSERMRTGALQALAQLSNVTRDSAEEALLGALRDEDAALRAAAAQALRDVYTLAAVDALTTALGDPSPEVRAPAATGLLSIARASGVPAFLSGNGNHDVYQQALGAVDPLIPLLQDENEAVRVAVVAALDGLGDVRAIAPLIPLLADPSQPVRVRAAQALVRYGDQRAYEPLMQALVRADLAVIASSPAFYIARARPGDEALFLEALRQFGSSQVAAIYMNCGNDTLAQAGSAWATANGYEIVPSMRGPVVPWGGG
jgi:HEAT repeat protein